MLVMRRKSGFTVWALIIPTRSLYDGLFDQKVYNKILSQENQRVEFLDPMPRQVSHDFLF